MDMEMKKDLAAMICLQRFNEYYTSAVNQVIDWLDEKGFLQEPKASKTPDGIMDRRFLDETRRQEIADAMVRYSEAGLKTPQEWTNEFNEITRRLRG